MKKVTLFATVVAASMLAGGVTAYTIGQVAGNDTRTYTPAAFGEQAGNHFTSYEADKYPDLTYAAENAVKGVVNIEVTKEVKSSRNSRFGGGGGFDPFFEFFGIPQGSFEQPQQPQQQRGGGSGVIISPDGYIVTNNHVVEDASEVKVTLNDNRTFTAKVIGTDPTTDVALVKIDATDLPNIPFGGIGCAAPRRMGAGHRQPLWFAKHRNGRHHQRKKRVTWILFKPVPHRIVYPDRRGSQPRQQRRRTGQHPRRAGRYQHRDQIAHRQFCRLLVRRTHLDRQKK